ncbi:MAG: hypothetical protein ACNA7V_01405 [Bacteroidales bacterium]
MVKEIRKFWQGKRATREHIFYQRYIKTILFVCLGFLVNQTAISQQEEQVLYGEAKVQNLKYLRSLSSLAKSEEGERSQFIQKFGIDLTSAMDARVMHDCWLKPEPSTRAHNSNSLIPRGTQVKIYKNADNTSFFAVRFRNKWGFIPESAVNMVEN